MGGRQAPRLCPRGDRRRARGCRPTPRRARRCSRSSSDTTPLVEGLSIDEAFLDVRGLAAHRRARPTEIAAPPARARCASRSGCRSRSAWRARSSSPRSPAASPSPTACSSCRPDSELEFLHPLPVERLWGVGPVTAAQAARAWASRPSGDVAATRRGGARRACSASRPGGTCTRSRTTATRGRVQVGRRRGSIGAQRALGRATRTPRSDVDAALVGLVDRVTRRMRAARPRRAHGRAAAAVRRLHARDALAHAAAADRAHRGRSSRLHAGCSRRPCR